jgi:ATP-binding cassette subfamily B protein
MNPPRAWDALSEQAVFEALGRLMAGKNCVVIAHHLATIQRADVIFVVKDFQLAERGTHAALLASGGLYAELYAMQFRNPEELPARGG